MSLLAAGGGGQMSVFDLASDNDDPHGIAYVHNGKGSLYVAQGNGASVYRYSLGGSLINEIRPANPLLPATGKPNRGVLTSLTECGGYLALVWHRTHNVGVPAGRIGIDCSITWLSLDSTGLASVQGDRTSVLSSNNVPTANADRVDRCAAPVLANHSPADSPYLILERGTDFWMYSIGSDPPTSVEGSYDHRAAPVSSGNLPSGRPDTVGTWTPANYRVTPITDIVGIIPVAIESFVPMLGCVIRNAAGIWRVGFNTSLTHAIVFRPVWTTALTSAQASTCAGATGHNATRRAWTVHTDGQVLMLRI